MVPAFCVYLCIHYIHLLVSVLSILFTVFLAGTGIMWFTDLYVEEIINQMTLREGSDVYYAWKKPPVKPLICIFVFNYTNIEEYKAKHHNKLKLQEVGPYCYRETLEKKNITFNDDGTITYGDTRKHQFEPEHSNGSQNDTLIVPNMALISLISASRNLNTWSQLTLSITLKSVLKYSHAMIKVKAHEFFFGYDDKLVKVFTNLAKILQQPLPFEKFGILAQRAASTDETTTVRTGTNDVGRIGIVTEINGLDKLDAWNDDECNRIDGSDGAFFPRHTINESATLYLFHKDMCRRVPFVYDKEVDFQEGVMAMRFRLAPNAYNTTGSCFCTESGCAPVGVFDISPCAMGVPIMMSYPHFLRGDPLLSEPFEGLHPNPEKHEFYIDVQRLLGFTLGTVSRLQLNIQINKAKNMVLLKEFSDKLILPIVWLQVSAEKMPPDLFNIIYHATFTVRRMQVALMWGFLILTIILGFLIYRTSRQLESHKVQEDNENKNDVAASEEMLPVKILRVS
ncbi:platelet glycoprotein 4-like isoform X2 [Rhodnius prolixus]|uniref:platelet glycoprotein 4-like isoform X2 n=1 Tax=Rhodnius prolixus TaxID=13249 RepID=UPI003D187E24